jgi:23S rRNA pseudoU1915 N3-methylase RlmH
MDYDKEIDGLAAETLAIQTAMAHILEQLAQTDQRLAAAIKRGFDHAASDIEDLAIKLGKLASPDHTVQALLIIEQLRTATLGEPDEPKHGV